jgi:hypothetical protein
MPQQLHGICLTGLLHVASEIPTVLVVVLATTFAEHEASCRPVFPGGGNQFQRFCIPVISTSTEAYVIAKFCFRQ